VKRPTIHDLTESERATFLRVALSLRGASSALLYLVAAVVDDECEKRKTGLRFVSDAFGTPLEPAPPPPPVSRPQLRSIPGGKRG
jgi:hypothetical protein